MYAISAKNITKKINNGFCLDSISFDIPEGGICALVGPNGSGKTLLLKLLSGIIKETSGCLKIYGKTAEENITGKGSFIGYMPQKQCFYEWMTAYGYLNFCGSLVGIPKKELKDWIEELVNFVGIIDVDETISSLNQAMKQRLGLAQALINQPRLLVLDHPTAFMDTQAKYQILEVISKLKSDMTVILSTDDLDGAGDVCDHVIILKEGRLLRFQEIRNMRQNNSSDSIYIKVNGEGKLNEFIKEIRSKEWTDKIFGSVNQKIRIKVNDMMEAQKQLPRMVSEKGLIINEFSTMDTKLSDVYLKVVDSE